jgi:hypothetical protein
VNGRKTVAICSDLWHKHSSEGKKRDSNGWIACPIWRFSGLDLSGGRIPIAILTHFPYTKAGLKRVMLHDHDSMSGISQLILSSRLSVSNERNWTGSRGGR